MTQEEMLQAVYALYGLPQNIQDKCTDTGYYLVPKVRGKTVWCISEPYRNSPHIREGTIEKIFLGKKERWLMSVFYSDWDYAEENRYLHSGNFRLDSIGIRVFFNRSEAQDALSRLLP